jgi:hypothetical protein
VLERPAPSPPASVSEAASANATAREVATGSDASADQDAIGGGVAPARGAPVGDADEADGDWEEADGAGDVEARGVFVHPASSTHAHASSRRVVMRAGYTGGRVSFGIAMSDNTEHVAIRDLAQLSGDSERPKLRFAVETRDRPGPAYKAGVYSEDVVWVQLRGGLFVAKARVKIAWRGEYSRLDEIRKRAPDLDVTEDFWTGRPRAGYAIVATLEQERWIEPEWAGPRTYAYEWIVLEDAKKRASWLDPKPPPRGGEDLRARFLAAGAPGVPPPPGRGARR